MFKAIAEIRTSDGKNIIGYIQFNEDNLGNTYIFGKLNGLDHGYHGMHIHEKGDSYQCCSKLGDHYNPHNKSHGPRTIIDDNGNEIINNERHAGDLGNIYFDSNKQSNFSFTDNLIKLSGIYSIIGRSIIIHKNKDDLGLTDHKDSKKTGNSGERIAYGIIGYA
jgi:Cu-Zn family superoxide dismutase